MPIYEYTCKKCQSTFDRLVRSAAEADAAECPHCQSKQTARKLSLFAVNAEAGGNSGPAPSGGGGGCACHGGGACGH